MEIEISADSLWGTVKIHRFREQIDNFSYLILCEASGKAAVIDPGPGTADRIGELSLANLEIECIINTHRHSDHTSGNETMVSRFRCRLFSSSIEAKHIPGVDAVVEDNGILMIGSFKLKFLLTPGHTPGSICILADDRFLFTGDTLFIGDCGRTDLPGGSNADMFRTMQRLKSLPDSLTVYPGHDYGDKACDTLGNQKNSNKCLLATSLTKFRNL